MACVSRCERWGASAIVSPDELQEALVALLQGYGPLIALLPEGAAGIKEAEWKGTAFEYPAVRIQRPMLSPWGNGNCSSRTAQIQVTVTGASKRDSSVTAQTLQGEIVAALDGIAFETSDVRVQTLRPQLVSPAAPNQEEIWSGSVTFRGLATAK